MPSRRAATPSSRSPCRRTCRRPPISSAWPGHATSGWASATSIDSARAWSRRGVGWAPARAAPCGSRPRGLARPWVTRLGEAENTWRFDPNAAGGGILADVGDHLLDALLWTTGQVAQEVAAVQDRLESGLDLVTAAAIRLADGTPAALTLSGISPGQLFELDYFGERGRLRVTDQSLLEELGAAPAQAVPLAEATETIDGNFVAAVVSDAPLCCPAEQALDTVRLLEAVTRSAAT